MICSDRPLRIAIRADASAEIGIGHVRRCGALAQALAALGHEVLFVCQDLGLQIRPMLDDGWRLATMAETVKPGEAGDARAFCDVVRGFDPDWVVVDHYRLSNIWHRYIRQELGSKLLVIDDLADRDLEPDLLIDHNWDADHRAKYAGRLKPGVALLGGPKFALLGPAYARAPRYTFHEAVRSIGVFMGGADAPNASSLTLDAIARTSLTVPVEVVTTIANPNLQALCERISRRAHTSVSIGLEDMTAFYARHDLQIGAAGGATWERFCIGAPTILLGYAENHFRVLRPLAQLGVAKVLDRKMSINSLEQVIRDTCADTALRQQLAESSRDLVDGLGAERVALIMTRDKMSIRPAGAKDSRTVHGWRNDERIRAVSRSKESIAFKEHDTWFQRTVEQPERHLLIGEVGTRPIGVVRFDRQADGEFEVSIYLDPDLSGCGLGSRLLALGEVFLLGAQGGPVAIVAETMSDNASSQRLFTGSGYRFDRNLFRKRAIGS